MADEGLKTLPTRSSCMSLTRFERKPNQTLLEIVEIKHKNKNKFQFAALYIFHLVVLALH